MSERAVIRGGTAGLLAAALLILSAILALAFPGSGPGTAGEYVVQTVAVLAFLAVIVAVVGIHARHATSPRYGRLGAAGAIAAATGYGVVALVKVISMIDDVEYLLTVRLVGAVLVILGSAVLGIVTIRARLLPWWCGVLLIVAFPLGDVANVLFATAENLLLALLWGSVGSALLRTGRTEAAVPAGTQRATAR